MKIKWITLLGLLVHAWMAFGQGTFQYDQQSSLGPVPPDVLWSIQGNEPSGQSFIPSLSAVGFVQLELFDGNPNNGLGATLYVNLRSNSITGPILSSSAPVFLPDTPSGGGVTNFLFSSPAVVMPGTTYFFEVVVQSGDSWYVNTLGNVYPGGEFYRQGLAQPLSDSWFREGVIIPEPSAAWLVLAVGAVRFYVRRKTH